ncbi:MAG TPA: hypothetical protein VGH38_08135 [Bryobacteraceae bacterium]|jgi:hypothetical protein
MKKIIPAFLNAALLGVALLAPVTLTPTALQAQEHRYHDKEHNDDHAWNNHEDRAYRIWVKEHHRKYSAFNKLKEGDQQDYWKWRHEHGDDVLKIH